MAPSRLLDVELAEVMAEQEGKTAGDQVEKAQ